MIIWFPFSWRKQMCRTWGDFFFYHTPSLRSRILILYLMFDTSHMQPQQSVPYSSQSLAFGNKSVHCQSYDSVCINKHFPMNGVTGMLTVSSDAPCVCVDWMSSDDFPACFLPPPIGLRSSIILHEMHSIEHSRTSMSQFLIPNRIMLVAAIP